ncbi:YvcK family protein [Candidatus Woesearchaeota archaeon]|nr:YvcK family protein [Candidatus Woesearchaeota archaeon]
MTLKLVAFGGGNAMPKALLAGLTKLPVEITTVTSMVDNGGSTGQFRKDFNVLPPGDIRRHLLALSRAPQWKKDLFAFRFGHEVFDQGHRGHSFGNAFLAGLENSLRDYGKVLEIAHDFLEVHGRCLPATTDKINVYAELENGQTIEGEDEIDVPRKHNPSLKIKRIFVKPEATAYPQAVSAIKEADIIAIGPGDLYSSSLPCFLPQGITGAIKASKAKKILVCNAMTKLGETQGFTVEDFAAEAEKYAGKLDYVLYNTKLPDAKRLEAHKKEEPAQLEPVRIGKGLNAAKFIGKDLLKESGQVVYDSDKVAAAIMELAK